MKVAYSGVVGQRGGAGGNEVVLGRKFCSGCGRWRPVHDYARTTREVGWGLKPRCHVCTLRYQRERQRQMTPEQRERLNEYNRIWMEVQRRREGVPARNFRHRRSVVDKVEFVGLPPEPLVAAIADTGLPDLALGAIAGVPPRSIYRLRVGESRHVRLDVADKLALALGFPLAAIYGDTPAVSLRARS